MTNVDQAIRRDNTQPAAAATANTNRAPGYGTNLGEDLITVLCWSDTHGGLVAELVDPALFPGEYSMIAERAIQYWKEYRAAPKVHIANLIAPELETPGRRSEHLRRTLLNMDENSARVNAEFVLDTVNKFVRTQKFKDALVRSAQAVGNNSNIDDAEKIVIEVLRGRTDHKFDAGASLSDLDKFFSLYNQRQHNEFVTGIPVLDMHGCVPARDTVTVLIAVLGQGKSWWLVHLGREALVRRKRVVHVSLELPQDQVMARYYQNIFAIPQSDIYRTVRRTKLKLHCENKQQVEDGLEPPRHRLVGFEPEQVQAPFVLQDEDAQQQLQARMQWRLRPERPLRKRGLFDNLRVRHFPMNTLTIAALRAYLDQLEATGFKVELLLLDHANCLAIDVDNFRLAFGRAMQDLEKLAAEKHIAIATAAQSNREGHKAKRVHIGHTGEDWSLPQTVDKVITLTRSEPEQRHGLGQLWVEKNRIGGQQHFGVVVAQNYHHGQFVLESAPLHADYTTLLEGLPG